MGKKILFESFVHQFLQAASDFAESQDTETRADVERVIDSLQFTNKESGKVFITSSLRMDFSFEADPSKLKFYTRGDSDLFVEKLKVAELYFSPDKVQAANRKISETLVRHFFTQFGIIKESLLNEN